MTTATSYYDALPLLAGLVRVEYCVWCNVPKGMPHRFYCRDPNAALGAMTSGTRTTAGAVRPPTAEAPRPLGLQQDDPLGAARYASQHARRVSLGCPHLMGNCGCDVPHYLRCDTMRDGLRCARGSGHYPPDQHVYKEPKNA